MTAADYRLVCTFCGGRADSVNTGLCEPCHSNHTEGLCESRPGSCEACRAIADGLEMCGECERVLPMADMVNMTRIGLDPVQIIVCKDCMTRVGDSE